MKIVDEKGKLFGLINIIDLCVLIIIVLVVGFVGYKYVGKKLTNKDGGSVQTITVDVKCASRYEIPSKEPVKPGDKLVSLTAFANAEVVSAKYVPAVVNVATADGRILNVTDAKRKDVYITFKMTADLSQPVIKLGSQEVAIGKVMIFKTNTTEYANAAVQDIHIK